MRLISTIIITCLISSSAFADNCPNAVRLRVGDVVKDCERIGLSLDEDLAVRKALKTGEVNVKILEKQEELIKMSDLQVKNAQAETLLYKEDAKKGWSEVDRLRSEGNTKLYIGIAVGVVGMLLAARVWGWVGGRNDVR